MSQKSESFLDDCIAALLTAGALYLLYTSGQIYFSDKKFGEVQVVKPSVITLKKIPEPAETEAKKVSIGVPNSELIIKAAYGLPGGVSVINAAKETIVDYNAQKSLELASNVKAITALAILMNQDKSTLSTYMLQIHDMLRYSYNLESKVLGKKLVGSPKDIQKQVNNYLLIKLLLSSWSGYNGGINHFGGPQEGFGTTSYGKPYEMALIIRQIEIEGEKKGFKLDQILGSNYGPGTLHIHRIKDKGGKPIVILGKTGTLHFSKAISGSMTNKRGVLVYFSVIVNASNARSYIWHMNKVLEAIYYYS